jgi:hypothetical protein
MATVTGGFPDVVLSTPYIGQEAYSASDVMIIQVADDVEGKNLRAFCQLGTNPSFKYWVPVLSGDDYTVDWTNDTVTAAVTAYFVNPTAA